MCNMDFGKVENVGAVNFVLPPDNSRNQLFLDTLAPRNEAFRLYTGATGWTTKEWLGHYYPTDAKPKDYLQHYGRLFNSIELNSTHYATPNEQTVQDWYDKTPPDFKFAPKVPQVISHNRQLSNTADSVLRFAASVLGLREKLGVSFLQLPPTFSPQQLPELAAFLELFPVQQVPLAVELRHPDWFGNPKHSDKLWEVLQKNGVGAVVTDVAGRRDVLHQCITAPFVLIRFVGNTLHETDYRRLDEWAARIAEWQKKPIKEVYFFLHQPDNILVPEAMVYFANAVNKYLDVPIVVPQRVQNSQTSLF